MQRIFLVDNIYHVLSRGVDKRKIFLDDKDYLRFIHSLFEFNDIEPPNNLNYFFKKNYMVIARPYIDKFGNKNSGDKIWLFWADNLVIFVSLSQTIN